MEKSKKIAIVATSPLQILLAHEICKKYKPIYVKCFIMTYEGDNRYGKCSKLAEDYGYNIQPVQMNDNSSRLSILKNCISSLYLNKGFDLVIQGMFTIDFFYSFSLKLLKSGGELVITDDGVTSFQLEDSNIMKSLFKSRTFKLNNFFMHVRRIRHKLFFTIFDNLTSAHYVLKKLSIGLEISDKTPQGVFFVGTIQEAYVPKYNPRITDSQFNNLIEQTVKYIRENYIGEDIFYTPHGREKETKSLQICKKWDLKYLPTEVSVEVDYPQNGLYPKVIIGFMSTALFTLRAMYPKATVIDIRPNNTKFINPDTLASTDYSEDTIGISRVYLNV